MTHQWERHLQKQKQILGKFKLAELITTAQCVRASSE